VAVQNYPLLEEFNLSAEAQPYRERAPLVAYVGGNHHGARIEEMVQAKDLFTRGAGRKTAPRRHLRRGWPEARCRAVPGWQHVVFVGWQSRPMIVALLGRARVGLVVLHPLPNYKEAYPVKLFEYMAAGLPVVASDFPLWRQIVEGTGCRLLVDPRDPQAIASAIGWLFTHPDEGAAMGERGRQSVGTTYNWGVEAKKLLAFYERLLA
jgi:hypothetical protein